NPPNPYIQLIVNGGIVGLGHEHKTEIHDSRLTIRDTEETMEPFTTSKKPYFPWGGSKGINNVAKIKRYPLRTTVYFDNRKPMFMIAQCNHPFTGKIDQTREVEGMNLNPPLKRLTDKVLQEWYYEHGKSDDEEQFGHDISNPFICPYIKYIPKEKRNK
ncbi:MAG TPA: hypothetical protein VIH27_05720, partial [Nitrososphaerales archaeon]